MRALIILTVVFAFAAGALRAPIATAAENNYISPYSVEFSYSDEDLLGDIISGGRGNPEHESSIPYSEWNSSHVRSKYGAWGPPVRDYSESEFAKNRTVDWKRQRLVAVAMRFCGYRYQHHHIPDWQPPADWPWLEIKNSSNSKGVDCSNFTTFFYAQALGIRLNGEIVTQSETKSAPVIGANREIEPMVIPGGEEFEDLVSKLETGDLLYIRSRGKVVHVITWIGKIGKSPDGNYLIIDSTGTGHIDSAGVHIPDGVHLRPFTKDSWYFKSFDHALRFVY